MHLCIVRMRSGLRMRYPERDLTTEPARHVKKLIVATVAILGAAIAAVVIAGVYRFNFTGGGDLHVMAIGDSIVNDTMRSGWLARLAEAYPGARVRGTVYVRGGGGCRRCASSKHERSGRGRPGAGMAAAGGAAARH
jgi:hypothetical protein